MHEDGRLGDVVVLPGWIAHMESIISSGVEEFRRLFQLRSDILDLVKRTIAGVLEVGEIIGEVALVGVHVRRRDYIPYLEDKFGKNSSLVTPDYYKRAMEKMRTLRSNTYVIFFIVSDDREWCMKELVNESDGVFWGGMEGSPFHAPSETQNTYMQSSHDFALLASLNDSIIGYGTYAVSAALLAGGHTIAFDLYKAGLTDELNIYTIGEHLDNWEYMT
ncbi:galactoside alpha-(1,2)-fucosyltransferase 1-like [Hetaerina americana]|uniref:galactoside alpha-(1,2)-fucosyltransferase 1-like n=1 Tax=Hetaerina americana TaxID=62018 RepID=UPI003A7F44D0